MARATGPCPRRRIARVTPLVLLAIAAVVIAGNAFAADDVVAEARAERANLAKTFPDAFAPVTDDPRLPRVLLIGDSISIGYTPVVRTQLAGVANVHRIPDNGGPTGRGMALLQEWLEGGRWDVIHFNFGLHDVARVNQGRQRTPVSVYGANLRALVERLRATGARLIFATTTPVPAVEVRPARRDSDVVGYNALATAVMSRNGVTLDDLYEVAAPRLAELQQPANVHFTPEGYRVLGSAVAAAIRQELAKTASSSK